MGLNHRAQDSASVPVIWAELVSRFMNCFREVATRGSATAMIFGLHGCSMLVQTTPTIGRLSSVRGLMGITAQHSSIMDTCSVAQRQAECAFCSVCIP